MPVILALLFTINRHYQRGRPRAPARAPPARRREPDITSSCWSAVRAKRSGGRSRYAELIKTDTFRCVHIAEPDDPRNLEAAWTRELGLLATAPTLEIVRNGSGGVARGVRRYVEDLRKRIPPDDFVTVIVSERVGKGVSRLVGSRTAFLIKTSLLFMPGVVVTDVPNIVDAPQDPLDVDPRRPPRGASARERRAQRDALRARVRAFARCGCACARSTSPWRTRRRSGCRRTGTMRPPGSRSRSIDSPYRDLSGPLLEYIRNQTSDGRTIVTIVHAGVHRRAGGGTTCCTTRPRLTLKRAFLTEPGVVVTNVPYRLDEQIREDSRCAIALRQEPAPALSTSR